MGFVKFFDFLRRKFHCNILISSFIASDLPMLLILSCYIIRYWSEFFSYPIERLLSLLSAAIWTYIGPLLIVRWIKYANSFVKTIDNISGSGCCEKQILDYELSWKRLRNFIIRLIWIGLVIGCLLASFGRNTLLDYHFNGFGDPYYFLFLICVLYIAYQTSWFFLFLGISRNVINKIIENDAVMTSLVLNEGKDNSLALVGEFISKTVSYYFSGLLMFPILIVFFLDSIKVQKSIWKLLVIGLMVIYIFVISAYLLKMTRNVANKAQKVKNKTIDVLMIHSHKTEEGTIREYTLDERIRYVAGLKTNPIVSDQYMKLFYEIFMYGFIPAVFAILFHFR